MPYYENEYEYPTEQKYEKEYMTNVHSKNNQKKPNQNSYVESANFVESRIFKPKIAIECKRCHKEFYFNNKLHRHLKIECRLETFS